MRSQYVPSLLLSLLLWSGSGWAQGAAVAEALFDEARTLLDAGNTAEACAKFAESQRLDPSAGTALNLGRCYDLLGRTASAWAQFLVAERLARAQQRESVAAEARRQAEELVPKLRHVTIQLTEPVAGLEVTLGETKLERAALGSKIPLDPGVHSVTVTAPGHRRYETTVTVDASAGDVALAIPSLAREPKPEPEPKPVVPTAPAPEPREPPPDRTAATLFGGAGIVALGGSLVLGFVASAKNEEARSSCGGRTTDCPDATFDAAEDASTFANVGTAVGILGLASLGTGVVLFFSQAEDEERTARRGLMVSGMASPSFTGLSLATDLP